jgi:hypothetical protein
MTPTRTRIHAGEEQMTEKKKPAKPPSQRQYRQAAIRESFEKDWRENPWHELWEGRR